MNIYKLITFTATEIYFENDGKAYIIYTDTRLIAKPTPPFCHAWVNGEHIIYTRPTTEQVQDWLTENARDNDWYDLDGMTAYEAEHPFTLCVE